MPETQLTTEPVGQAASIPSGGALDQIDRMAQRDADAAGSGVTQGANPFDALAKRDREKQDGAMQSALSDALKVLPDRAASDQYMAKTLGLPVDMVERNRDQVQQQFRLRELQQVMQASPVLRAQMSNPDFAKLAHDDAPVLNDLEQVMQFLGRSGKATLAGVAGISEGLWGLGRAASGYIPDAAGGRLLEDWTTYENQQARGVVQRLMPQAGGTVEAGWYSGPAVAGHEPLATPARLPAGRSGTAGREALPARWRRAWRRCCGRWASQLAGRHTARRATRG